MTGFDLNLYLQERKAQVEYVLDTLVAPGFPETLFCAMRYSLLAGGKRLRPILCLASCEMLGGGLEAAMPTACALEMIHTMSLIHDDLPAMDNDDLRRGMPTNHKKFGEAMAVLAGDALLAFAFQVIAQKTPVTVGATRILDVVVRVGRAAGSTGIVGGQVIDIESTGKQIPLEILEVMHAKKTGALLECAVVSGGVLAGAEAEEMQRLGAYALKIGLAFQIIDDILDVVGTTEKIGKTIGKDRAVHKATYPSLLGLAPSRAMARQLIQEAKSELAPFGSRALPLLALADFITEREH
ncbi:polyprenyl synthetase family protein [Anthocerotibacter panamensis]|uniref:polyprenyl synthetase family protein n=1 Tax=Anthocerotibacter panamensis TaxID=2857077 RepID=UPI001C405D07|nr:farnesyl diphosphate synthase [Anthocerotibacter panamensis]